MPLCNSSFISTICLDKFCEPCLRIVTDRQPLILNTPVLNMSQWVALYTYKINASSMLASLDVEGPNGWAEFNEHPKTSTDVHTEQGKVRATLRSEDISSSSQNCTVHRSCRILQWDGICVEEISNNSYLPLTDARFSK